jgi:4-carboxymuconolactone decarboxylase
MYCNDEDRATKGNATFREVMGIAEGELPATSPFKAAARDILFAEVWSRPGLDRRSRRWITLAAAAAAGSSIAVRTYARAAVASGDISMAELREFALQLAMFQGFPKGAEVDMILDELEVARPNV